MRKAFAADFGAGNTCIYWINPNAEIPTCTAFNNPRCEPSGYAVTNKGSIRLGLGLYGLQYSDLNNISEFHINLKEVPYKENRQELISYFSRWREKLLHNEKTAPVFEDVDEEFWFMGCPTGAAWKEKAVRELYKEIFEDAGFPNVSIVPESNGAFAYFAKTQNILQARDKKIFLIDIGAYSIDATPYFGDAIKTSYGKYLGAGIIDRMILHAILYDDEKKFRIGNKVINLPETINEVRRLYEQADTHEKFSTYMLLQARQLKEDYFTKEEEGTLPQGNLPRGTGFFVGKDDDAEEFMLFANRKMMNALLKDNPICTVLGSEFYKLKKEEVEYIGKLTWLGTLEKFLRELGEEYDMGDGNDSVIMLTGGGSLMPCVTEKVREFFPQATIYNDPQAISAIGQGICYWSPDKIRAIDFEETYRIEILEKNTGDVMGGKFNAAFKESVSDIAKQLTQEERDAINHGITKWRTYECDSSAIPDKIEAHFKNWCEQTGIPTFTANLENRINDLKNGINDDFKNKVLSPLNMLTQTAEDTLLTVDNKIFLAVSKEIVRAMFDFWREAIALYYKEHENWYKFPNDKKGYFSNPRQKWYDNEEESLKRWIANETEATTSLCESYFCEWHLAIESELDNLNNAAETFLEAVAKGNLCKKYFERWQDHLKQEGNPSLMKHYSDEGRRYLESLMIERKKEILGKLVLEELLDDE